VLASTVLAAPPAADPHDQLTALWRSTVDRLTELSIQLHSFGDDTPTERVAAIESCLASARRTLVEVETSLHRLRSDAMSVVSG
jgi:hypothetical protein